MSAPSAAALHLIPKTNNPSDETHFPLNVARWVEFYTRVRSGSQRGGQAVLSSLSYHTISSSAE